MSITISEVLSLHIFKDHTLLTGQAGITKIVESVGIIDCFSLVREHYDLFTNSHLQNKLLLSTHFASFVPEDQVECLNFLNKFSASGLVILQSDLIEGSIADEAIQIAEKLDFPIIQSPNQYPSYSELIIEVMRAITSKSISTSIGPALRWLKGGNEERQTMEQLLEVITKSANLYIGLYDWNLNLIYTSAPEVLQDELRRLARSQEGSFCAPEGEYYFKRSRLNCPDEMLSYIIMISSEKSAIEAVRYQITDIIQLFASIRYKPVTNYAALGNALLNGDLVLARHYERLLSTKIDELRFLVFCPMRNIPQSDAPSLLAELDKFCVQNCLVPIINRTESGVTVFLKEPVLESDLIILLEEFSTNIERKFSKSLFPRFLITSLPNPNSARENYAMCLKYHESIEQIFPHKTVFSYQQILFAKNIIVPFKSFPDTIQYIDNVLSPLRGSHGQQLELIETLSTYLLDANGNSDVAARILMLHKSTVKYRIKRANELLDYDIRKMPESYNLYLALAVARLLK